jgi:peptidoglycan-associated lipoprotein
LCGCEAVLFFTEHCAIQRGQTALLIKRVAINNYFSGDYKMKKTALALVSALLLLSACDSSSSNDGSAGGAGSGAPGTGSGILGQAADGSSISDRVFFATDSSVVEADGQAALDKQAAWLKGNSNMNITIEGHADERGTREYNIALGERRATAVKSYLVSQGVSANRINIISYGKERPAVTGNDESAWSQNRRGVTVIAN